ncbi:hypothetical protein E4U54_005418, partial [Claviceps lovelessii]
MLGMDLNPGSSTSPAENRSPTAPSAKASARDLCDTWNAHRPSRRELHNPGFFSKSHQRGIYKQWWRDGISGTEP